MLAVFYQTLDNRMPKWQLESSLIGANPGLGFRPMPPESNVESTLIWYKASDDKNIEYWTNEIDTFLEVYQRKLNGEQKEERVNCNFTSGRPEGRVCDVPVHEFSPCISSKKYNYDNRGPCIFLKLNKIYNWKPDFYIDNETTPFPSNMPKDLVEHIKESKSKDPNSKTVWVSCEGENPADVENMGAINYIPGRGFPGYYFPFQNTEGYLSPLVAVYFEKPKPGVLINIECKAWAQNIHHDRHDRRGSVHFELMVDY